MLKAISITNASGRYCFGPLLGKFVATDINIMSSFGFDVLLDTRLFTPIIDALFTIWESGGPSIYSMRNADVVLTSWLERRIVGASWLLRIIVVIEFLQVGDTSLVDATLQVLLPRLLGVISVGGEDETIVEVKDETATLGVNLEFSTDCFGSLD